MKSPSLGRSGKLRLERGIERFQSAMVQSNANDAGDGSRACATPCRDYVTTFELHLGYKGQTWQESMSNRLYSYAAAIRRANNFSAEMTPEVPTKDPVVWIDDIGSLILRVDYPYINRWEHTAPPESEKGQNMFRDQALEETIDEWPKYHHLGPSVPTLEERAMFRSKDLPSPDGPSISASAGSSAAEVVPDTDKIAYVLIEFCCDPQSTLCSKKYEKVGDEFVVRIRLTEAQDMTKPSGLEYAMNAIKPYTHLPIVLWGSIPCTGGSQWGYLNRHQYPSYPARYNFLLRQYKRFFGTS